MARFRAPKGVMLAPSDQGRDEHEPSSELQEMLTERIAADPILSQALRVGPGGTVDVGPADADSTQAMFNALAAFDDALLGMVYRLADAVDGLQGLAHP